MNMKMLKKIALFMLSGLVCPIFPITVTNPTLFTIPIEFPTLLKKIPQNLQNIYLFYCGRRIDRDDYTTNNKIFFSVLESRMITHFYLMIIDSMPDLELICANTVDYLKVDPSHRYKFYSLSLVAQESEKNKKIEYVWIINEVSVPASGQLPDNTLLMTYNPDLVDHLEGGNAIELPTIVIKKDLEVSDEQINQQSVEIILSALDYNAFHESTKIELADDSDTKTIRIMTT